MACLVPHSRSENPSNHREHKGHRKEESTEPAESERDQEEGVVTDPDFVPSRLILFPNRYLNRKVGCPRRSKS